MRWQVTNVFLHSSEVELIYPTLFYNVGTYDYDGGVVFNQDDFVGRASFNPYQSSLLFPDLINFNSGNSHVDL